MPIVRKLENFLYYSWSWRQFVKRKNEMKILLVLSAISFKYICKSTFPWKIYSSILFIFHHKLPFSRSPVIKIILNILSVINRCICITCWKMLVLHFQVTSRVSLCGKSLDFRMNFISRFLRSLTYSPFVVNDEISLYQNISLQLLNWGWISVANSKY